MIDDVKQLIKFLTIECVKFSLRLKLIKIGNYSQTQHFIVAYVYMFLLCYWAFIRIVPYPDRINWRSGGDGNIQFNKN
jgi:hypothetical protein